MRAHRVNRGSLSFDQTSNYVAADFTQKLVNLSSSHRMQRMESHQLPPLKNPAVPCEPWDSTRPRHNYCLISGKRVLRGERAECQFCPAAAAW